jgi:hypothetical protein
MSKEITPENGGSETPSLGELKPQDLAIIGPIVISAFAFAYVVGYFFSFDIAWFSFFTLSEHLVFAVCAPPVAIGAVIALLIVYTLSIDYTWYSFIKQYRWLFIIIWIIILMAMGIEIVRRNHIGSGLSFLIIGGGVFVYNYYRDPRQHTSMMIILYWSVNIMVTCFIVGFFSGISWQNHDNIVVYTLFGKSHSMCVIYNNPPEGGQANSKEYFGHVIFEGTRGVLFYDYRAKSLRFIQWRNLGDITGGEHSSSEACMKVE